MEKYCRAGQAPGENTIRRMRIACWITYDYRHTLVICNTYYYSLAKKNAYANAPQYYVIVHCLSFIFVFVAVDKK